jgi:hypothetical protein
VFAAAIGGSKTARCRTYKTKHCENSERKVIKPTGSSESYVSLFDFLHERILGLRWDKINKILMDQIGSHKLADHRAVLTKHSRVASEKTPSPPIHAGVEKRPDLMRCFTKDLIQLQHRLLLLTAVAVAPEVSGDLETLKRIEFIQLSFRFAAHFI